MSRAFFIRILRWAARNQFPPPPADGIEFMRASRLFKPELDFEDLTGEILAEATTGHGVDLATALFYDRLRLRSQSSAFIAEVNRVDPTREALPRACGKLLIVPAALYAEYPEFLTDAPLVRSLGTRLGMDVKVAPIQSLGTVSANARILANGLRRSPPRSVFAVTLSKGGADLRLCLEDEPELKNRLSGWLNICGLLHGSPLADQALELRGWRRILLAANLKIHGADSGFLDSLRVTHPRLSQRVVNDFPFPVINLTGCPLKGQLSRLTRRRFAALEPFGPNDGANCLLDGLMPGGFHFPVWGADHFFMVPDAAKILYQLMTVISRRWLAPALTAAEPSLQIQ